MTPQTCAVVGCNRRTSRFPDCDEIICGLHWRAIPVATKRRRAFLGRERRRIYAIVEAQGGRVSNDQVARMRKIMRLEALSWRVAKAQAVQRAAKAQAVQRAAGDRMNGKPRPILQKTCEWCAVKFTTKRATARFCGNVCQVGWQVRNQTQWTCETCATRFKAPTDHGQPVRFCSRECWRAGKIAAAEKECAYCGGVFLAPRTSGGHSEDGRRIYCSKKCAVAGLRSAVEETCAHCGDIFMRSPSRADRCCSQACARAYYRESLSHAWKGGRYTSNQSGATMVNVGGAKYQADYRLIAGRAIGRALFTWEVVIRIDRELPDTDPSNLFICASMSEYARRRQQKTLPWPTHSNLQTYADRAN